jgi:two-component system, NtrC family, response regulator AtoC
MPHALAVDDDPNFLNALAELIENQGFTTHTATTLRDARERLLHKQPDIALIDLRLPDGSGMELLRELEKLPTEVIVITGHADVDSAVEALRIGAADYLTKPLDIARLKEILAAVRRSEAEMPTGTGGRGGRGAGRLGLLLGASPSMLQSTSRWRGWRRPTPPSSSSARAAPARTSPPRRCTCCRDAPRAPSCR